MIIIKGTENDLSFITNSLRCKENILENKGINIIKYDTGRIYRTLQQSEWTRQGTYYWPFNRASIAALMLGSAFVYFSYNSRAFFSSAFSIISILSFTVHFHYIICRNFLKEKILTSFVEHVNLLYF